MMDFILTPLLEHTGVTFLPNNQEKKLCMTYLEATLSHYQLGLHKIPDTFSFIENENHCIMYKIRFDDDKIQQESIYFQLKETYDLKLYNKKRFYVPKTISLDVSFQSGFVDFDDIKYNLHQFIFTQVLDIDGLIDTMILDDYLRETYENVAELILCEVLQTTAVRDIIALNMYTSIKPCI